MATIKLGMLVSNISGSIGGTTFRRFRGGLQMYNKPRGASNSKTLKNPKIKQLNEVAFSWSNLDALDQAKWKAAALNFQFNDKFGDPKNLTGFEFYVKLFNFNINVGNPLPNPDTLSNVVVTSPIFNIDLHSEGLKFIEFATTLPNSTVLLYIEKIRGMGVEPIFKKRKLLKSASIAVNKLIDFSAEFAEKYPNENHLDCYAVYWCFQNPDGFQSPMESINRCIV